MGLLPNDFYDMETEDFLLMSKGFAENVQRELELKRFQSYIVFCSGWHGKGKPPSIEKFWPLGNKAAKINEGHLRILKEMRERDALKKYSEKHGG